MCKTFVKIWLRARWLRDESGQDLIEYALIVALISFAATAGMSSVAGSVNNAFSQIASTLASYIA